MALNHMDLKLIKKGLCYTEKNKNLIVALGALGVTSFGAYKAYNSTSMIKKKERLLKLLGAVVSLAQMVSDSDDATGFSSKDLKELILSGSDQIPFSLKQIFKIPMSHEFSESIVKFTSALTIGILKDYKQETEGTGSYLFDHALDKLFSDSSSGFASVIAGNFARNSVLAFYKQSTLEVEFSAKGFVDTLFEDKCRELIGNCVQVFVSTAVTVYLDKAMHVNTYNEIFSGLTNPKNEAKMRDMLVSICSGAVETLVKTSHKVLTSPGMDVETDDYTSNLSSFHSTTIGCSRPSRPVTMPHNGSLCGTFYPDVTTVEHEKVFWYTDMMDSSISLGGPSSKRLALDLMGRITFGFEYVRSFLELVLGKLCECLKRYVDFIHEEVVDWSAEGYRCVSGKSSAAVSICLGLCLHILNGPWILVPT